jgi:putative addiction module component (TIGR02574 family)
MTTALEDVESAALDLSQTDRARLAHRLIESLDEEAGEDLDEVQRLWAEEIERRVASYRAGDVATIPAAEVFAEARARLPEH